MTAQEYINGIQRHDKRSFLQHWLDWLRLPAGPRPFDARFASDQEFVYRLHRRIIAIDATEVEELQCWSRELVERFRSA